MLNKKLEVISQQAISETDNEIDKYFNGFGNIVTSMANNYNLVNGEDPNQKSKILLRVKELKEDNKEISNVYAGFINSTSVAYVNNKTSEGDNIQKNEWYKQAISHKGEIIISLPYKDSKTGKIIVSIARAVEKNGKAIGACAIEVALDNLIEKINTMKIGTTGYIFISDLDGSFMIAHTEKDLIGTDEASKLPFWNDIKNSNAGNVKYTLNNVRKSGIYETNDTTNWKLLAVYDEKEIWKDTYSIIVSTVTITLIIVLIAIVLSLILSKGIAKNIKQLNEVFKKTSKGDFTNFVTATTKDEFMELAVSYNSMTTNISELMNSVVESSKEVLGTSANLASMSEEVTASIGEVAKVIEEVSKGATNQAQNALKGVSEINDLADRLDGISINSNEMDKLSKNTNELGSRGLVMIDTLIEKSNKTKISTNEVNEIVLDMNESTKKISTISERISEITEQTNLLSLNASIESARAGEAGKGFAVVAEEIRKLAEQSKQSTEEIKVIIAGIQKKSDTAVNAIRSTENMVNEQDLAVNQAQKIFSEILQSIGIMINKVQEVKKSIIDINENKQSTVMEIENISAISEETASASEEVTASTEEITAVMEKFTKYADELQLLTEKLDSQLDRFKFN
jgi:methyl-accepting chemotaxis protein